MFVLGPMSSEASKILVVFKIECDHRAGSACLDSALRKLSGFLPG